MGARRPLTRARVSVLIKRFWGPRSIGLQEGVWEDEELSHDCGQSDFCRLSDLDEVLVLAFMSGLNRAATRAGM